MAPSLPRPSLQQCCATQPQRAVQSALGGWPSNGGASTGDTSPRRNSYSYLNCWILFAPVELYIIVLYCSILYCWLWTELLLIGRGRLSASLIDTHPWVTMLRSKPHSTSGRCFGASGHCSIIAPERSRCTILRYKKGVCDLHVKWAVDLWAHVGHPAHTYFAQQQIVQQELRDLWKREVYELGEHVAVNVIGLGHDCTHSNKDLLCFHHVVLKLLDYLPSSLSCGAAINKTVDAYAKF